MSVRFFSAFSSAPTRRVWASPDAVLLVFAASAAEFAASKAVDWLFFTGRLPEDPIGRFFETARFARRLAFSDDAGARRALERINRAHLAVERARGQKIPAWAYRDVLFMLIDYGERAHEVVYGAMSGADKAAHFEAAINVGRAMGIEDLPENYPDYRDKRKKQLEEDYRRGVFTERLYESYLRALGPVRYHALLLIQAELLPEELRPVLGLRPNAAVGRLLGGYRRLPGGGNKLGSLRAIALPRRFCGELRELSRSPTRSPNSGGAR